MRSFDEGVGSDEYLIMRIRELCRPMAPRPTGVESRLCSLEGIRAVLFDVYGTLVISGAGEIGSAMATGSVDALSAALAATGLSSRPGEAAEQGTALLFDAIEQAHEARRREGIAYPEVDICRIWSVVLAELGRNGLASGEASAEDVRRLAVEYEFRANPVWPMPGLDEALEFLRGCGVRLGIVSNAQFFTPLMLEALLGRGVAGSGFVEGLCCWSYKVLEAKPSKRLFEIVLAMLAEKYGVVPGEVLYVGNDMRNDIRPAAATGCRTALFAGDERSLRLREGEEGTGRFEPDVVLTDLRQLKDVLGQ